MNPRSATGLRSSASLNYDPQPQPKTIGEWIASERRRAGLAKRRLAQLVGWDPTTIERYEADRVLLPLERRRVLEAFFRQRWTFTLRTEAHDRFGGTSPT